MRGLLCWMLGGLEVAYLDATLALFLWFNARSFNLLAYPDELLWRVRPQPVRELRGQAFIQEGQADLRREHWAEAEMKLRFGLMRFPEKSSHPGRSRNFTAARSR